MQKEEARRMEDELGRVVENLNNVKLKLKKERATV
jgi:hypothetical protein